MAHKKHPVHGTAHKKSSKVPLAPASKAPKTTAPTERRDGSPKLTETKTSPAANTGGGDFASSTLRSYNIPDYRLERPEFRIFMSGEGESLEYRIEGDLSAPPPPIRESKY